MVFVMLVLGYTVGSTFYNKLSLKNFFVYNKLSSTLFSCICMYRSLDIKNFFVRNAFHWI